MEITCINCPVGCRLSVTLENGQVTSVTGNTCTRGEIYARQECVDPQRMVTAVIPVAGSAMPLSVQGRPSSSHVTVPPNFRPTSICNMYPSTDGANPVV